MDRVLTRMLEEGDDACADRAGTAPRPKRGEQVDLVLDDPYSSDEHRKPGHDSLENPALRPLCFESDEQPNHEAGEQPGNHRTSRKE